MSALNHRLISQAKHKGLFVFYRPDRIDFLSCVTGKHLCSYWLNTGNVTHLVKGETVKAEVQTEFQAMDYADKLNRQRNRQ